MDVCQPRNSLKHDRIDNLILFSKDEVVNPAKCKKGNLMQIQDAAIEYSEQGFSVIPIQPGWDKKPLVSWKEFQKRRATPEKIDGWFQKWPDANIGIVTGSISGVAVVDADSDNAEQWVTENCPATGVYQETSRGRHAFYKPNDHPVKTQSGVREKIDIRGAV